MANKAAKESFANKLGFKSSGSKAVEAELEKLKKENGQLKKSLDEMRRNGRNHPTRQDSDKSKLLERILSLETLRERNTQQLLAKEKEISVLRQQLQAECGEVVASLQNQLDQKRQELEQREKLFQNLSLETEDLKNKLLVVTEKFQSLEKRGTDTQVPSGELAVVQEQLRDALEKNQHWLVYDQQREAYVQGILARTAELEQQLNQAKQHQQTEACSEGQSSASNQLQEIQKEMEEERKTTSRLRSELQELKDRYEEKSREVARGQDELQEERRSGRQTLAEERKLNVERVARLQGELEAADVRLAEERKRAAELLLQVNFLQKSILTQHEDQKKMALLEQQQIQMSSSRDFEKEKLERQSLQHQLHKVLKELRKARDQITHLETKQRETRFSEPSSYARPDVDKLTIRDCILNPTSPLKSSNALDESFLECPSCRASYPTSQHRELLAHIDYCFR